MSPLPADPLRSCAPVPHCPDRVRMVFVNQGCLKLTGDTPQEWVQGYLLSKPLPKADLLHLLAAGDAMAMARAATP